MAYCTLDDITKHLPESDIIELTDDAGAGAVDQKAVDEAIGSAGALIDGYLARRYVLPIASTPPLILPLAVDLTIYNLFGRRRGVMPEEVQTRRDEAVKVLKDLSTGVAQLPGVAVASAAQQDAARHTAADRVFDAAGFTGYPT